MRFDSAVRHDPAIDEWFDAQSPELADLARPWFELMREQGDDVRELLHDFHPTACAGDKAFAYVNVFSAHVNVGFFLGTSLDDPSGLLEGTGKFMRHVKLRPGNEPEAAELRRLIEGAYQHMRQKNEDQ